MKLFIVSYWLFVKRYNEINLRNLFTNFLFYPNLKPSSSKS